MAFFSDSAKRILCACVLSVLVVGCQGKKRLEAELREIDTKYDAKVIELRQLETDLAVYRKALDNLLEGRYESQQIKDFEDTIRTATAELEKATVEEESAKKSVEDLKTRLKDYTAATKRS